MRSSLPELHKSGPSLPRGDRPRYFKILLVHPCDEQVLRLHSQASKKACQHMQKHIRKAGLTAAISVALPEVSTLHAQNSALPCKLKSWPKSADQRLLALVWLIQSTGWAAIFLLAHVLLA